MKALTRQWLSRALWSALILTGMLLLAAAGGALYLWGWQWRGELDFHESWTAEERAALTAFEHYLRDQQEEEEYATLLQLAPVATRVQRDGSGTTETSEELYPHWKLRLIAAMRTREWAGPAVEKLRAMAESGSAGQDETYTYNTYRQVTPAILAAQTGHTKALEALIKHGANPNTIMYHEEGGEMRESETPLSPLLTCRNGSWEQLRPTAEFLIQNGADINGPQRLHSICCTLALYAQTPTTEPWNWALDKGMRVSAQELCVLLFSPHSLTILERILREKKASINAEGQRSTPLQALMRHMAQSFSKADMERYQCEEKLDLLLACGADPNQVHSQGKLLDDASEDGDWLYQDEPYGDLPLDIYLRGIEFFDHPDMQEVQQRIISKMRAAGARSTYQPQN